LLAEETAIALDKLNKEPLYLTLEIRRHQINTTPSCKIYSAKVKPDLLTLGTINRAHPQRFSAIIKEAWIAEIGNNCLRQFSLEPRNLSRRQLTKIYTHHYNLFRFLLRVTMRAIVCYHLTPRWNIEH
jgi:hypothetical protein